MPMMRMTILLPRFAGISMEAVHMMDLLTPINSALTVLHEPWLISHTYLPKDTMQLLEGIVFMRGVS